MSILSFESVSKSYGNGDNAFLAVDNVSLTLETGAFTAVRGPSGCGKTTLLLIAGGLLHPSRGTARVKDVAMDTLSGDQRAVFRADNIGFVFQQFHLIPYLSVLENILVAASGGRRNKSHAHAMELLKRFGLERHAHKFPSTLSTGERQRVALTRAMINRPILLLADEPTGNLDDDNGNLVLDALAEFAGEGGAVLLVTHDHNATSRASEVLEMRSGCLVPT